MYKHILRNLFSFKILFETKCFQILPNGVTFFLNSRQQQKTGKTFTGLWTLDYWFRPSGADVLSFITEKSSRFAIKERLVSISILGSCLIFVFLILKYKGNGGNRSIFHASFCKMRPLILEALIVSAHVFICTFGPLSKLLIVGFQRI